LSSGRRRRFCERRRRRIKSNRQRGDTATRLRGLRQTPSRTKIIEGRREIEQRRPSTVGSGTETIAAVPWGVADSTCGAKLFTRECSSRPIENASGRIARIRPNYASWPLAMYTVSIRRFSARRPRERQHAVDQIGGSGVAFRLACARGSETAARISRGVAVRPFSLSFVILPQRIYTMQPERIS